jgi:acetyl esterase
MEPRTSWDLLLFGQACKAAKRRPQLIGVAPAFIITADHDPLRDEGDEYAAKLKAANVAVDYTCWPSMIHGLASLAGVLDAGKVLIDQIGAALRKAFKPSRL